MNRDVEINKLRCEIRELRRQVEFLVNHFGLTPDRAELERAVELMLDSRDTTALDSYLARGGKIMGGVA